MGSVSTFSGGPRTGGRERYVVMETRTGRHYVISALKRHYADRVPTTVLVGPYCARLTDYSIRDILTDARKSAEAHMAFFERFHPDSMIVYNDVCLEAEALGCPLDFPEDAISHIKGPILDDKSKLARLKVPDPKKDARLPYFFELCERVSSQVKRTATTGLGHSGPWNIAVHLRGPETLIFDTVDDPGFVHELMRFGTEVVRTLGDALIEAGFSPSVGEASASCSLISPKIYREFIKPYHKQLCDHFKSRRSLLSMHICGYTDPILEDVMETGIGLFSLDGPSSLKKLVECAGTDVAIMGNVPTHLFSTGTREEMEEAIRGCIDTAAEGSGYMLSSGCEIPYHSTEDRIEHYFAYSHEYGRQYMSRLRDRRPELFVD